jgi:hypothetical protein
MTITLEPTPRLLTIDGVVHRVWQGRTGHGIEVHAYVSRVAAIHGCDTRELDDALRPTSPLRPELRTIPASATSVAG